MLKTLIFLLAFGITVVGWTYIVIYLNLLDLGYSFNEYIKFISKRSECLIGFIGFILITIIIFKGGNECDLYI